MNQHKPYVRQRSALAYSLAKLLHKLFATEGKQEYQKSMEPVLSLYISLQHEHQNMKVHQCDGLF